MGQILSCFGVDSSSIVIEGRRYSIRQKLGEGGFSFVFLVTDSRSGVRYACKRIACQDEQQLREALREVELTRLFDHPNIIPIVASESVVDARIHGTRNVHIVMPFFPRGTLQDSIETMRATNRGFSEDDLLETFRGICLALRECHHYKNDQGPFALAHRDVKPGNVLLKDDGTPVLMDFGSMAKARVHIATRKEAVVLQDTAAERCSMPYRAPELFNVPSDSVIDERVDIWSLGCTLYAIAYHESPFEAVVNEKGGSLAMAVQSGRITFPVNDKYSRTVSDLIQFMLVLDHTQRPSIDDVLQRLDGDDLPPVSSKTGDPLLPSAEDEDDIASASTALVAQ